MPLSLLRLAMAGLAICLAAAPVRAQVEAAHTSQMPDGPLHEQVLSIPGDRANPVTLQVTVFTPTGNGPFPLAIMNHGATHVSAHDRGERYRFTLSAYYFLSRGYAVALPMMRGFAGSGGSIVHRGCDLADVGVTNARDIQAVIDTMATQPYVDGSRIVVAGQSFGGWNTLAYGTIAYPRVKGLIDFVGIIRASDCSSQDTALIGAAGYFGAHTRLPSIWFYGDNDTLDPVATWRGMYQRYTQAGGHAELIAFGRFMRDAHQLLSFPESMQLWAPKVDAFLTRVGLPGTLLYPEYVPMPFPPPTQFASIDDVAAVPYLNDAGRALYRKFLSKDAPRVFAIAPGGSAASFQGGVDPLGRALRSCGGPARCHPYAVDDAVVWVPPRDAVAGAQAASSPLYHKAVVAGATSTIDFAYSVNPDCSVKALPRMSVVQPPQHGVARIDRRSGLPKFPPASPFAVCDRTPVAGTALEYTPAAGFSGADFVAFEVDNPNNEHHVVRVALLVR